MATIDIKASTVTIEEKRAAEICSILGEIGVEFTFKPTRNPNPKMGHIKLNTPILSVRAERVLKTACELNGLDYEHTCISEFVRKVPRVELIKIRNCGKRALEEIDSMFFEYGFSLA